MCVWWHMSLVPGLRNQRQVDLKFKGNLVYKKKFQDRQGYMEKLCLKQQHKKWTTD